MEEKAAAKSTARSGSSTRRCQGYGDDGDMDDIPMCPNWQTRATLHLHVIERRKRQSSSNNSLGIARKEYVLGQRASLFPQIPLSRRRSTSTFLHLPRMRISHIIGGLQHLTHSTPTVKLTGPLLPFVAEEERAASPVHNTFGHWPEGDGSDMPLSICTPRAKKADEDRASATKAKKADEDRANAAKAKKADEDRASVAKAKKADEDRASVAKAKKADEAAKAIAAKENAVTSAVAKAEVRLLAKLLMWPEHFELTKALTAFANW
eukprot:gene27962-8845_t